jgi:hypothetical protein
MMTAAGRFFVDCRLRDDLTGNAFQIYFYAKMLGFDLLGDPASWCFFRSKV